MTMTRGDESTIKAKWSGNTFGADLGYDYLAWRNLGFRQFATEADRKARSKRSPIVSR